MLKLVVTAGCVAAMVVAGVVTFRLRDQRRAPSPLTGAEPLAQRLAVTVGRTGGMLAGALVSGILTIGAGGRLMMRVLAATSSDRVQGSRTEADAVVGEVTAAGSFFLVVAIGIAASAAGLVLFAVLRRWLPDRSITAGLLAAAIGAGLLVRPTGLLTSSNRDFEILDPAVLAVALCLVTIVLFGATFGVVVDCLAARWPRPGASPKGIASVLPFLLLVPAPPLLGAVALGVLAGTIAPALGRAASAGGSSRAGRLAVLAAGALGAVSILVAGGQVLAL